MAVIYRNSEAHLFRKISISFQSFPLRCTKLLAHIKSGILFKLENKLYKLSISHKSSLNANSQLITASARIPYFLLNNSPFPVQVDYFNWVLDAGTGLISNRANPAAALEAILVMKAKGHIMYRTLHSAGHILYFVSVKSSLCLP
jgi:hypothetical protein